MLSSSHVHAAIIDVQPLEGLVSDTGAWYVDDTYSQDGWSSIRWQLRSRQRPSPAPFQRQACPHAR